MNTKISHFMILSACAAVLTLGASKASAQSAKFDLPVEAHWGTAVLTPGNYTLSSPEGVTGFQLFYLRGSSGTQMAGPAIIDKKDASGPGYLQLVKVDGTYYVQKYVSEITRTSLEFAVPKSGHRQLMAKVRVLRISGS